MLLPFGNKNSISALQLGNSDLNSELSGCDPISFLKKTDSCAKIKPSSEPGVTKRRDDTEQTCLHKLLALACQEEVRRLPIILPISQQARYYGKRKNIHTYVCVRVCVSIHPPIRGETRSFFPPRRVERTETCLTLFSVCSLPQAENASTRQSVLGAARATGTSAG